MSVACNHIAPNGEKSNLYQQLEAKYGEDKAHDMWTAIRTQQFLNKYGDWTKVTFSSNETEVRAKIAEMQQIVEKNRAVLDNSRTNEYRELASLEKPSVKLELIPARILVEHDNAALGIAHNKIVKEATALQQLMRCL